MKIMIIGLIIVFLVWRFMPAKGVQSISIDQLKKLLKDKSKQFIDVRTPGEYKRRSIKQFKNIPLNQLPSELSKLDKKKETFVICQSGMRSTKAANVLKKAGFPNVINVRGGMSVWRD